MDNATLISTSTLSDIADAVRAKTGSTDTMAPVEMPARIAGIQTGGVDTVNGVAPVNGNVQLSPENIGAAPVSHNHTLDELPACVSVTGHTHSAGDISGVAAAGHTHEYCQISGLTPEAIGAADRTHTHTLSELSGSITPADIGAAPCVHSHTLADLGGTVTPSAIGAAPTSHVHSVSCIMGLTPAAIGAAAADHSHDFAVLGVSMVGHTHDLSGLNVAPAQHNHSISDLKGEVAAAVHTHSDIAELPAAAPRLHRHDAAEINGVALDGHHHSVSDVDGLTPTAIGAATPDDLASYIESMSSAASNGFMDNLRTPEATQYIESHAGCGGSDPNAVISQSDAGSRGFLDNLQTPAAVAVIESHAGGTPPTDYVFSQTGVSSRSFVDNLKTEASKNAVKEYITPSAIGAANSTHCHSEYLALTPLASDTTVYAGSSSTTVTTGQVSHSVAIGSPVDITGYCMVAIGYDVQGSNIGSVIIGEGASTFTCASPTEGLPAVVIGQGSQAVAPGPRRTAAGGYGVVIGDCNYTCSSDTILIGSHIGISSNTTYGVVAFGARYSPPVCNAITYYYDSLGTGNGDMIVLGNQVQQDVSGSYQAPYIGSINLCGGGNMPSGSEQDFVIDLRALACVLSCEAVFSGAVHRGSCARSFLGLSS